jgi:hypothetical protein
MPPKVQHDDTCRPLAICHATMQVRPFQLPVYRTAALLIRITSTVPDFRRSWSSSPAWHLA